MDKSEHRRNIRGLKKLSRALRKISHRDRKRILADVDQRAYKSLIFGPSRDYMDAVSFNGKVSEMRAQELESIRGVSVSMRGENE